MDNTTNLIPANVTAAIENATEVFTDSDVVAIFYVVCDANVVTLADHRWLLENRSAAYAAIESAASAIPGSYIARRAA